MVPTITPDLPQICFKIRMLQEEDMVSTSPESIYDSLDELIYEVSRVPVMHRRFHDNFLDTSMYKMMLERPDGIVL